jgi:decaprenylphospho-beta-D-erythro-pentofuranosid-2-ulose 2-reductase
MNETVLILGATSGIARGTADAFARRGRNLILAGRDEEELQRISSDLSIRYGIDTRIRLLDIVDLASYEEFCSTLLHEGEQLSGVVCAVGYLGEQEKAFEDSGEAVKIIASNYMGPALLLDRLANMMLPQKKGFIVGIASVAGDRGRQSNFIYGSAKGGFALFLQGLRNRLFREGIQVLTIKPGFVDTAMTYGLSGMFLVAQPDDIGENIYRALEKGRDSIYLPRFWRYIMLIIRLIPEKIFKRMGL